MDYYFRVGIMAWVISGSASMFLLAQPSPERVMTLEDCIRQGLAGNRTLVLQRLQLASASADVQRVSSLYDTRLQLEGFWQDSEVPPGTFPAQGGVERGQGAGRILRQLPSGTQIGVEVDVQRNLFEGMSESDQPLYRTVAGISLRQSLWKNAFGAGDRAQIDYTRGKLQIVESEYERRKEEVAARIADLYWQAWTAQKNVGVQSKVIDRLRQLLESNRRRVEDGLLDETAIWAVEASLAVAEVDVEVLRHQAQTLDEQLKDVVDLPAIEWDFVAIDYREATPMVSEPLPDPMDIRENAERYRQDLEAWRREEKRVEDLIRLRRLSNRSDLEVSGSIGRGDSDVALNDTLDFDRTLWSVGATYEMSLGRSATEADLIQAYLEKERIATTREMLEREIDLEARAAYRDAGTSWRMVQATERALAAQLKILEMERRRFDRGQSEIKTLLDYENARDLSERDHVRAIGLWERAKIQLLLVQGIVPTGDLP